VGWWDWLVGWVGLGWVSWWSWLRSGVFYSVVANIKMKKKEKKSPKVKKHKDEGWGRGDIYRRSSAQSRITYHVLLKYFFVSFDGLR